jgi:hypothetical protein
MNISEESNGSRAGFKGERPGRLPRGLHKTEIEFIDFSKTYDSLKLWKVSFYC